MKLFNVISVIILSLIVMGSTYTVLFSNNAYATSTSQKQSFSGPKADKLILSFITSPSSQVVALKRGDVDGMVGFLWATIPPTEVSDLESDPNIKIVVTEKYEYFALQFNCQEWPLNITEFRRAIAYMINKEYLIKNLYLGYAHKATTCIPEAQGGWHNSNITSPYTFNLTKAAKILDKLGFVDTDGNGIRNDPRTGKDMRPLKILVPSYDPVRIRTAQYISQWAASIGVPIKAAPTDLNTMLDLCTVQHKFDMVYWSLGYYPPWENIYYNYHSSQYVKGGWNVAGYINKTWDQFIEQMLTESNPGKLKGMIWKFQKWELEELPDYPVIVQDLIEPYRIDKVTGVVQVPGEGVWYNFWTYLNVHAAGKAYGGVITVPLLEEPKTFNPCKSYSEFDWFIQDLVYDHLLRVGTDLSTFVPWMAKSYNIEVLPNNSMVMSFNLHQNITWHDGIPLTADDVKFTIEGYKTQKIPSFYLYVKNIYKIETPDKYTVKIYVNDTSYTNLYNIGVALPILPKHIWENVSDWYTYEPEKPIGSGPFMFVKWVKGEYIELEKNPSYFKLSMPTHRLEVLSSIPGVTFKIGNNQYTTPAKLNLSEGEYTIEFPKEVVYNSTTYKFLQWDDGLTNPVRAINLTSDLTTVVTYTPVTTTSVTSGGGWSYLEYALAVLIIVVVLVVAVYLLRKK